VDEDPGRSYRPIDLARRAGLSASQIRNYERFGFLPPAERASSGHRRYGRHHLAALQVSCRLIDAFGWPSALQAMRAAHHGDPVAALAVADERHAHVHQQRLQVRQTLDALAEIQARDPHSIERFHGGSVAIGNAAVSVGATTTAIRYWESRGLIQPERTPQGRRRYSRRQLQQLQLVKLLRDIDYDFDTIRSVVKDLADPHGTQARAALDERQDLVNRSSRATADATRVLLDYLETTTG
jgi:DNA-binding transcriptional MerR regulator